MASIKDWLGRKILQFIETLTQTEQERFITMECLFTSSTNKFKQQYNETTKPLQFQKLVSQVNENAEEWMGRLRLTAVECNYKELNRQLKEQFIHV